MKANSTPQPPAGMTTPRAIAQELGLPVDTVRGWVRRGLVPSVRFGPRDRLVALEPTVINQLRREI